MDSPEPVAIVTRQDPEHVALTRACQRARVILDYGAGAALTAASRLPGKLIFGVEDDFGRMVRLQHDLDRGAGPSTVILYHAAIEGEGVEAGLPSLCRYALAIWDEAFFHQPDLVLIGGPLRAACLLATALRTTRPLTAFVEGYADQPLHRAVERWVGAPSMTGSLARFDLQPGMIAPDAMRTLTAEFFGERLAGRPQPVSPPDRA